jgi:hypothetical protein
MHAATLLLAASLAALAAADGDRNAPLLAFPDAFIVVTGTTVPFVDIDPVAQSGSIYFDLAARKVRIDSYWMGNQRSFIADLAAQRGYLVNNAACVTSKLTGQLRPMGVPRSAVADPDAAAVRGVRVDHYSAQQHADEDMVEIDYFVRRTNFTAVDAEHDTTISYNVPWRVSSRRSNRRQLTERPTVPNWRFYGEKIHDEIVSVHGSSSALSRVIHDVAVTMDFYNFVPMRPDDSIFEPPAMCDKFAPTETFEHDVDVMEAHRNLMDLSFNNEEGRKLMDQLWHPKKAITEDDYHTDL